MDILPTLSVPVLSLPFFCTHCIMKFLVSFSYVSIISLTPTSVDRSFWLDSSRYTNSVQVLRKSTALYPFHFHCL